MSAFAVPIDDDDLNQCSTVDDVIDCDLNDDEALETNGDFDYGFTDASPKLQQQQQHQPNNKPTVTTSQPAQSTNQSIPRSLTTNPPIPATIAEIDSVVNSVAEAKQRLPPTPASHYIVGTLIVRVVAGRDIPAAIAGGFGQLFTGGSNDVQRKNGDSRSKRVMNLFSSGTSNPYCRVSFGGNHQQMQQVFENCDPVFPRESAFFDVKLPTASLAIDDVNAATYLPPSPVLTIDVLHSDNPSGKGKGKGAKDKSNNSNNAVKKNGEADNIFTPLGNARIHILDVLTGKVPSIDEWFPLSGGQGAVRVCVEYEAADEKPRSGDICRLNGFCTPKDLFPVPAGRLFYVDDVDGDDIILSYTSEEDWLCTFHVHRFCVINAIRHQRAIEQYQDQIIDIANKLAVSPLVENVIDVYKRIPEDGLIGIGVEGLAKGSELLSRWFSGGSATVFEDVKMATNWDGRIKTAHSDSEDEEENDKKLSGERAAENVDDENSEPALEGMPCCPITGMPMKEPVVAADGHTYERSAILRWFEKSDKSPLTGKVVSHKDVVVNFSLINQIQEIAIAAAALAVETSLDYELTAHNKVESAWAGGSSSSLEKSNEQERRKSNVGGEEKKGGAELESARSSSSSNGSGDKSNKYAISYADYDFEDDDGDGGGDDFAPSMIT